MKSSASAATSWGKRWDSFVPMRNTKPCEWIILRAEWYFASVDLFRKTTDICDAFVATIGTVTPIPFSRNSKMKDNNSSVHSAKQPMQPACMLAPCSHIHSLALNHCLILFYPSKMHGRGDVHISASLHTTHAFLLDTTVQMRFIFCCTVNLLLLITTGTDAGSFGGNPSSSSLLLLSSGKLMVVNVDGKTGIKCSAPSLFVLQNYVRHGKGILV
jgi:hypothetical protein